jgi:hypothetical protein
MTRRQAIKWVNAQTEGLAQDDWQGDLNEAWLAIMGRPRDDDEQDDGMAYSMLIRLTPMIPHATLGAVTKAGRARVSPRTRP